ncbi:hypothetical protein KIW84_043916 [Lathyrus oleraceus]|uniref:Sec39 domain-containing protein n=1 Tax=Pisum sativum TaxID=3888 RepID=A0A9D5AUQ5_PEA|nr:hypothetical protein KIW84_043916 [Pisum sativum]
MPNTNITFIATLDLTGCLHIFKFDKESLTVSRFLLGEKDDSLMSDNLSNGGNKSFLGCMDFTWWCDHVIAIVDRNGVVMLIDILNGSKVQEEYPAHFFPALGRAQKCRGYLFLLVSLSSKERSSPSDFGFSEELHQTKWIVEDRLKQFHLSRLLWFLVSFSEKSIPEMYGLLIRKRSYQAALDFADRHGLDKDEVLKSQWLNSSQGVNEINIFLANIKDKKFVLSECVHRVVPTEDAVKASLAYGLRITDHHRFSEVDDDDSSHVWDVRLAKLQILQFRDRLETFLGINMGRFSVSFPSGVAVRQNDWVECKKTVDFINTPIKNHGIQIQVKTEPLVNHFVGLLWPSIDELSKWYMDRARAMDAFSGQLDNCLSLLEFALRKGIYEFQQFHQDVLYLHQVIYSDDNDSEAGLHMSLVKWEEFPDYERFKFMLRGVKEESVTERLHNKAIPFMREKFHRVSLFGDGTHCTNQSIEESFLARWLKEIALQNKLDMCLVVIEEGRRNFQSNVYFEIEVEAFDCALQCIYLFKVTDRWSIMAAILSKLPQMHDGAIQVESLERRLRVAESHIEAWRLLAFYQVPKPLNFFLGAQSDEKGVKQIIRLILSKFIHRQPGRSDSEWASMWRDMEYLREKTFPFLDLEYILIEFCRGLLKAGKFSLARNYLKGTSSVSLASEKAENLVIQAARDANVKAEADIIDALTVKLPNLGVNNLPMQFRQIKDPMEIVKMAITNPTGAYFHVEELVEVARLLGLKSADDVSVVEEAIAREAVVSGDLQLASDLCLVLSRKGHGNIWDLCAAIARGPALENMEVDSRKQLWAQYNFVAKVESIMKKVKDHASNDASDLVLSYNVLLKLYTRTGRHKDLVALMKEMKDKKMYNRYTFATWLNAYATANNIDEMEKLLAKVEADRIEELCKKDHTAIRTDSSIKKSENQPPKLCLKSFGYPGYRPLQQTHIRSINTTHSSTCARRCKGESN